MILSNGVLVKSPTHYEYFTPASWNGIPQPGITLRQDGSYAGLYRTQLWVSTVVNKLAMGTARLPLKVYRHDELNRPEVGDRPYAQLLARPNVKHNRFFFWLWLSSTYDVFGEAFLLKIRDPGGRPVALAPLHPSGMHIEDRVDGQLVWSFQNDRIRIDGLRTCDLVHPKTYNPDDLDRGLSRLEPLRRTLEFEDAAQRAQSSFWRKGARPGMALSHPGNLTKPAADRLKLQWDQIAAGADNTGTTVVLEEGMKPEVMSLTAEEAQYIESRKLNREEVCAGYDVPPPAVHILDRATFSNITENLRSMYRDTQAPRLRMFESCFEHELRASSQPGASGPDFPDGEYAEFLLDEVLRGDFEARATAYQQADYMTLAEKRRAENLPFIDGTDRIFVNAATVPLDAAALNVVGGLVSSGYNPDEVLAALDLPPIEHTGALPVAAQAPADTLRSVMGRLSRATTVADINVDELVAGLDIDPVIVRTLVAVALDAGHSVDEFRAGLKAAINDYEAAP